MVIVTLHPKTLETVADIPVVDANHIIFKEQLTHHLHIASGYVIGFLALYSAYPEPEMDHPLVEVGRQFSGAVEFPGFQSIPKRLFVDVVTTTTGTHIHIHL